MRTQKRLTEAYRHAQRMDIDETSKLILFSDCHRGNGSLSDDFTKNQNIFNHALSHYYNEGYTYIEAGDGDELWEHPHYNTIKNAHFETFTQIKKFHDAGRLIMMIGNHNNYFADDHYVKTNLHTYHNRFTETDYEFLDGIDPIEALVLNVKATGQEILIVHGHQGDLPNDQNWWFSMVALKYFWRFVHAFGFRNPASPASNVHKRHKVERNYVKWIHSMRMMLICGHTHRYKFPKADECPYFNIGCCIYPTMITGLEIFDGKIQLVAWKVVPNDEGILQVTSTILRGPEDLSAFDVRNRHRLPE